jgi:hypothetical protein
LAMGFDKTLNTNQNPTAVVRNSSSRFRFKMRFTHAVYQNRLTGQTQYFARKPNHPILFMPRNGLPTGCGGGVAGKPA